MLPIRVARRDGVADEGGEAKRRKATRDEGDGNKNEDEQLQYITSTKQFGDPFGSRDDHKE